MVTGCLCASANRLPYNSAYLPQQGRDKRCENAFFIDFFFASYLLFLLDSFLGWLFKYLTIANATDLVVGPLLATRKYIASIRFLLRLQSLFCAKLDMFVFLLRGFLSNFAVSPLLDGPFDALERPLYEYWTILFVVAAYLLHTLRVLCTGALNHL